MCLGPESEARMVLVQQMLLLEFLEANEERGLVALLELVAVKVVSNLPPIPAAIARATWWIA